MSLQRLANRWIAAWGLILPLLAAVVGAQDDPGQNAVRVAVEKGRQLLKKWEIEEARSQFEQARIASNDQAAAPFVGLAEVELKLDNLELALQLVDKALALVRDPVSKAEILNLKGLVFFGYVGRTQLASAGSAPKPPTTAEGLETLSPEKEALDEDEARAERFAQYWQARKARAKVAETYFREALELSGGSLNAARLNLAEALQRQGEREQSRQLLEEYQQRASTNEERAAARDLECWLGEVRPTTSKTPPVEGAKPGKLTPARRKRAPNPNYPRWALKKKTEGIVVSEMIIGVSGDVECVRVIRGLPDGLSEATAETLKKWKFKPATVDGRPVRVYSTTTTTFRLNR